MYYVRAPWFNLLNESMALALPGSGSYSYDYIYTLRGDAFGYALALSGDGNYLTASTKLGERHDTNRDQGSVRVFHVNS